MKEIRIEIYKDGCFNLQSQINAIFDDCAINIDAESCYCRTVAQVIDHLKMKIGTLPQLLRIYGVCLHFLHRQRLIRAFSAYRYVSFSGLVISEHIMRYGCLRRLDGYEVCKRSNMTVLMIGRGHILMSIHFG